MALDDFQRRQRQKHLGSSDAPAIAGVDPGGRTAGDVWAEKTGRVQRVMLRDRGPGNTPRSVGTYLEGGILSWLDDHLGTRIARDQFKIHPNGILAANLDGLALAATPPAIVEAKSIGMFGRPRYFDAFGPEGTDEVPDHILVQTHHQLAVCQNQPDLPPIDLVLVPVLLVSRGFVLFRVRRNQDLCDALVEQEEQFWRDHVLTDRPPPDDLPTLETLKRLRREAQSCVEIEGQLVRQWDAAKGFHEVAKKQLEEAQRALIAALGDAEAGVYDGGRITYLEQTRKAYEVPESTFRVLRWKKEKEHGTGERPRIGRDAGTRNDPADSARDHHQE